MLKQLLTRAAVRISRSLGGGSSILSQRVLIPRVAHGPAGIEQVGHREYVGGLWQEVGELQFRYLVGQGLKPHHYFLDIACGCLRGGVLFIPYLDAGHYLGIDKERTLIQQGINEELPRAIYEEKQPRLLVSAEFEFDKFGVAADFALAQSFFTHLPPSLIQRCLNRLRGNIAADGTFYATFWEAAQKRENPDQPHDHGYFVYSRGEMAEFGERCGWVMDFIGEWGHPRGQKMVRYKPR